MLSNEYHLKMHANRQLEKSLYHYSDVMLENFEAYDNILTSMISMCDESGIQRETKYLARKMYDTFALKNPNASPLELEFAASNCFRQAIKFNEDSRYHDQLTIEKWRKIVSPQFTTEDFIQFEILLYNDSEYSMNFTTPSDYHGVYSRDFPMTEQHRKGTLLMLDLSFTIPALFFYNAEQIYFGCLLAAHQGAPYIPVEWILNQTIYQEKSLEVAQIMSQIYQQSIEEI